MPGFEHKQVGLSCRILCLVSKILLADKILKGVGYWNE